MAPQMEEHKMNVYRAKGDIVRAELQEKHRGKRKGSCRRTRGDVWGGTVPLLPVSAGSEARVPKRTV